jgi:hypothetical protein
MIFSSSYTIVSVVLCHFHFLLLSFYGLCFGLVELVAHVLSLVLAGDSVALFGAPGAGRTTKMEPPPPPPPPDTCPRSTWVPTRLSHCKLFLPTESDVFYNFRIFLRKSHCSLLFFKVKLKKENALLRKWDNTTFLH